MPSTDTRDEAIIAQARQLVADSREAAAGMGRFDLDPIAGRRPTAGLTLLGEMVRIVDALRSPAERGEGESLARRAGDVHRAWHEGYAAGVREAETGAVQLWQDSETRAWLYPDGDSLASPPAPVEGERERRLEDIAQRLVNAVEVRDSLAALIPLANEARNLLAALPVQGEREERAIPTARDFGARLREARVAAGLSLRDAAELLGTSTPRLGRVERGVPKIPSRCAWCGRDHESWQPCASPAPSASEEP